MLQEEDNQYLKEEVIKLNGLLENERRYRLQLEDDNRNLLSQLSLLTEKISHLESKCIGDYHESIESDCNQLNQPYRIDAIIVPTYCEDKVKLRIPNACDGTNVIACLIYIDPMGVDADLLLCCGSNSSLHAYDSITGIHLFVHKGAAPVISLCSYDDCVACGLMDGQLSVVCHYQCMSLCAPKACLSHLSSGSSTV